MFDLVACKRIAQQLHIHHQMTFWLLRCVGLRISEAYGIALEDIYRYEGEMTIRIWRQGGKNFKVADEEGNKRIVKSKTTVKTLASQRVLPIARPVAELIDRYIEAFHDGETDLSTPLLRTARGAGQSGFRDALQKATIAAGCGVEDVGFAVTPHTHRKFFATDLDDISPRPRSIYMGHHVQNLDGGAAITESTYTVKRKGVEHLLVVAKTMTSLIESSIVSLVEPVTASHLLPASACPDYDEREHALEVFDAAGFIGITAVDGEEVVEVAEAAALLGLGERKVTELARDGLLVRQRIAGAGRSSLFGVTVTSVQEHMSLAQQSWSRKKICLEFSLAYHQVDYLIKALGVVAYEAPASRGYRYLDSEVDKIRRYLEEKAEALRNAVSLAEVMDELSCTRRTATHLISIGRLELDATTTAAVGFTMVTRNSLARLRLERSQRRMLPEERPLGSIPIREAQVRTGLDRAGVLGLKTEDVVILRTADYQFHVDEVSLQAYLNRR